MNKNTEILHSGTVIVSENSSSINVGSFSGFNIQMNITDSTPDPVSALSGSVAVDTLTFPAKAAATGGDYVVITDTAGLEWAVYCDVSGLQDEEPTGAIWTAIPAAQKGYADISAATDAASVAAIFELAFDALVDVPFATDDSAGDGTMLCTQNIRGTVAVPQLKNVDDSGVGSITASSVVGTVSAIVVASDSFSIPTHGFITGNKVQLTTDGTLPTGLSLVTDYYIIAVDGDNIQFAASYADALAGTEIAFTDQGSESAENTITPVALAATYLLQKSIDGVVWSDIGTASNITGSDTVWISEINTYYSHTRLVYVVTAGQFLSSVKLCGGN